VSKRKVSAILGRTALPHGFCLLVCLLARDESALPWLIGRDHVLRVRGHRLHSLLACPANTPDLLRKPAGRLGIARIVGISQCCLKAACVLHG
jgi:hypothetical protein